MNSQHINILVFNLGLTDFKSTWDLQRRLFQLRVGQNIPDILLLNEHQHVYTFGKNSDPDHLLAGREELIRSGAEVFHIDRGGDVTYHGPGQLVGYPILDLKHYYFDVHRYMRDIEEVLIRTLKEYGITATRDSEYTGVWVAGEKIAAIGIKVSHWVTMHGFALNVNTDLSRFHRIIPCGIFHRGVTSLGQLVHDRVDLTEVSGIVVKKFEEVFGIDALLSPVSVGNFLDQHTQANVECLP